MEGSVNKIIREGTESVLAMMSETAKEFFQVAHKLSNREDDIQAWSKQLQEEVKSLCENILNDINTLDQHMLNKIEDCLKTIEGQCKTLQIEMPKFGDVELCIYEDYQHLKQHILKYDEEIKKRQNEVNDLIKQEKRLCDDLGVATKQLKINPLPSQSDMDNFTYYLQELENERYRRLDMFCDIHQKIKEITKTLGYVPQNSFERYICLENCKDFRVTDSNMNALKTFYEDIKNAEKTVKEEITNLRSDINNLWNILDVDLLDREEFQKKTKTDDYNTLKMLQKEKERLVVLKKTNIKMFIDRLREELTNVWKQCYVGEKIKENFDFFETDCYTEDLLELHEMELKKWQQYYAENKNIIHLIEKYLNLWHKMLELESNAANPGRYKNRGGQLLTEEKERNTLSKQIPKIEERIQQLNDLYQQKHQQPFSYYDCSITDYILKLHADRENSRKQKLDAKKQQTVMTTTTTTTTLNLSLTKRKLISTPRSEVKRLKLTPHKENILSVPAKVKVPSLKLVSSARRLSYERNQRIKKIRKVLNKPNDTYIQFKEELAGRSNSRSTLNEAASPLPLPATPEPDHPKKTPSASQSRLTPARSHTNLKLIF